MFVRCRVAQIVNLTNAESVELEGAFIRVKGISGKSDVIGFGTSDAAEAAFEIIDEGLKMGEEYIKVLGSSQSNLDGARHRRHLRAEPAFLLIRWFAYWEQHLLSRGRFRWVCFR